MAGGIDFPNTPTKNKVFFYTDPVTAKVTKWLFNGNSWVLQEWAMEEAPLDGLQYARTFDEASGYPIWEAVVHVDPDVKEAPAGDETGDPALRPIYARQGPTVTTDPILPGAWIQIAGTQWTGIPLPPLTPELYAQGHDGVDWRTLAEADILDLDKYTKAEVDAALSTGINDHTHIPEDVIGLGPLAIAADVPIDGSYYLRNDADWAKVIVRPVELRESMSVSYPENTDDATLFWTAKAITVIGITAHIRDVNADVTFNVLHASTRNSTAASRVLQGSNVVCNSLAGQGYSSWDVNKIPANSWVWLNIGTVANQQSLFHFTVTYVENDVVTLGF